MEMINANDNKVLLVSAKETFSIHGMEAKLSEIGFEGLYIPAKVDTLTGVYDMSDVIVYYMNEKTPIENKFVVYLKDLCLEKEKKLILIGRREEYDTVLKNMPEKCVDAWFERPLDMNRFLLTIKRQFHQMKMMNTRKIILILDDDVAYMQMIRDWLMDTYEIVMVNTGVKAIRWLSDNKADLVLLDYEMPVLNGPTFFEMLKSSVDSEMIPVMFLTGQKTRESVLTAMKLKPVDYLLKSITKGELREKLEHYFSIQKTMI